MKILSKKKRTGRKACYDGNRVCGLRRPPLPPLQEEALTEGSDGLIGVFKDFEEIEDANEFQSLQGELGRIEELERAAILLGESEEADEKADAARIDHGDFFEVKDEADVAGIEEVGEGGADFINGRAENEFAAEFDDFGPRLRAKFDVQGMLLPADSLVKISQLHSECKIAKVPTS